MIVKHSMNKIIKSEKWDDVVKNIFLLSIGVYLFSIEIIESQLYFMPFFNFLYVYMPKVAFCILIIKIIYSILRGAYRVWEMAIYCVLVVFLFLFYSGSIIYTSPYLVLLYMIACKDVDIKKILWCMFVSLSLIFLLIVILSLIGVIVNHPVYEMRNGVNRARWLLGYDWRNMAQNHLLSIILLFLMCKKNVKLWHYIFFIIVSFLMFKWTDSRTAMICIIFALVLYFIFNNKKENILSKYISKLSMIFPVLCAFVITFLSYIYNPDDDFFIKLNKIFTRRLMKGHNGFLNYKLSLYEQNLGMKAETIEWIDSSFLNILFNKGIIFFVIIIAFFTVFMYIAYKKKDKNLTIMLTTMMIYAMVEPWLLSLAQFPITILFIAYFFI